MTDVCKMEGCARKAIARNLCSKHYLRYLRNGNPSIKKKEWKKKLTFNVTSEGCFEVTSHKTGSHGYPQMQYNRKPSPIHRMVYEECFGTIPSGLVVRHKCDNKLCVNPEHLEIGTIKDNNQDAVKRGRNAFGERNSQAKLTEKEVREIKNMFKTSVVDKSLIIQLAKEYNVHINTLYDIYYNRTWKHVKVEVPS